MSEDQAAQTPESASSVDVAREEVAEIMRRHEAGELSPQLSLEAAVHDYLGVASWSWPIEMRDAFMRSRLAAFEEVRRGGEETDDDASVSPAGIEAFNGPVSG